MKRFLLNIWDAQRNAAALAFERAALASESARRATLADGLRASMQEVVAIKEREEIAISLAITLAVEYRAALGNPTENLPVSIQEAHALRGRHTKWSLADDRLLGERYNKKQVDHLARKAEQYAGAGLAGWDSNQQYRPVPALPFDGLCHVRIKHPGQFVPVDIDSGEEIEL